MDPLGPRMDEGVGRGGMTPRRRDGEADASARQAAAERTFGVRFASFRRLAAGNSSANYRALAQDGRAWFVKFAKPKDIATAVRRARAVSSPLVPALAFGGRVGSCGCLDFCALEWLERGASVDPADMTPEMCGALVAAYRRFSEAMQAASGDLETPCDLGAAGFGTVPRAIHGDMHFRNIFFYGGEVAAFFDLEKMRMGHPAEDLLRVFVHALERTRFWWRERTAAILRAFSETVRRAGFPASAWMSAIALYERRKADHRARKSRFPLVKRVEAAFRAPLYARLRAVASAAAEGGVR